MSSVKALMFMAAVGLAACQSSNAPQLGPDGKPLPEAYKITPKVAKQIPVEALTAVNDLRAKRDTAPLTIDPSLTHAAFVHSKDMALQNRPWHWDSDGSSPLDRAKKAGFGGEVMGENISETYENEVQTLSAWMATKDTRNVLLNPNANVMGIGWYQEPEGKIWWTLITGNSNIPPTYGTKD